MSSPGRDRGHRPIPGRDDITRAVIRNLPNCLKFLLQIPSLDVNRVPPIDVEEVFCNYPPLLEAVKRGIPQLVEILLQDPRVQLTVRAATRNVSVLEIACTVAEGNHQTHRQEILWMLLQKCDPTGLELYERAVARADNSKLVQILLEDGRLLPTVVTLASILQLQRLSCARLISEYLSK